MEQSNSIRNFCVISHIDHGKSTLADRFLELTKTVEKRKMREQFLDMMELERERGITIKLQPVRMKYKEYILNLIDTPGHIDFSYEVSRALKAVEGAILLVDATQGVQAQTITNVEIAKSLGLTIIPVINKIDLPSAQIEETRNEIIKLLGLENFEILEVSAKTGEGVEALLEEVIKKIPPPASPMGGSDRPRALVFDFEYSLHQGMIVYIRMVDGQVRKGDELVLAQAKENFVAAEVGIFTPNRCPTSVLGAGEIGYLVTNIKKPSIGLVGDSVISFKNPLPSLPGYLQPKPVVWASLYPESQNDFDVLKQSLERLKLSDSSLSYEEEKSSFLGRGFKVGFLGMLHLEIIIERLKREFNLDLIVAAPTVGYVVELKDSSKNVVYSPMSFPDEYLIKKIFEPWAEMQIIVPAEKIGLIIPVLYDHEAKIGETGQFGGSGQRALIKVAMPLRELMRNFFDELKSVTAGYGSLGYKVSGLRETPPGAIARLDILVAEEVVPAFSRIVSSLRIQKEAKEIVEKLAKFLPRALFIIKIQAKGLGRILASRSLPALKKDVTGYLYGGDRTRKMKLWQRQKKGKKRLREMGKVNIPQEIFTKMLNE